MNIAKTSSFSLTKWLHMKQIWLVIEFIPCTQWECDRNVVSFMELGLKKPSTLPFFCTSTNVEVNTLFYIMITKWLCNRFLGTIFFSVDVSALIECAWPIGWMHFEFGAWKCMFQFTSRLQFESVFLFSMTDGFHSFSRGCIMWISLPTE